MQDADARNARGLAHGLAALAATAVEEIDLWPCNLPAWQCWQNLQTQWRVGMAGRTGLDYAAVLAYLRAVHGLRGPELLEVFGGLQGCEMAILELQAEREQG